MSDVPPQPPDTGPPTQPPPGQPPSRRAARAALAAREVERDAGPSVLRTVGIPVLLVGCAAAVLVSSLTLPGRGDAAAATTPDAVATSAPARSPAGTSTGPAPRRTTPPPAAEDTDGTHVTLTLRSRPRSRTDQEFGVVGRHLGTLVLDDPARSDGDAARRSASFDVGRGGFVIAWRSRDGWTLESLACTTTDGNLATSVRSTVVVVTTGGGEVRCTAVVARA